MSDLKPRNNDNIKNKKNLRDIFDMPQSAFFGGVQIEIQNNKEAMIDGCKGVLEYNENTIKLACEKMSVKFSGRDMQIKTLSQNSALITGYIMNIEFIA